MRAERVILESGLVVIVRGVVGDAALSLAEALCAGGVTAMELTFDQADARSHALTAKSIERIRARLGDNVCVGAGTVVSAALVERAHDAGAEFIVSPDVDAEVISSTKARAMCSFPGAMTPTEILSAHKLGADIVKLFPAGALGDKYLKAVCAPINHIPIFAVGGVDASNARAFLDAGAAGLGVGGNLVSRALIADKKFDEIERRARALAGIISAYRAVKGGYSSERI